MLTTTTTTVVAAAIATTELFDGRHGDDLGQTNACGRQGEQQDGYIRLQVAYTREDRGASPPSALRRKPRAQMTPFSSGSRRLLDRVRCRTTPLER